MKDLDNYDKSVEEKGPLNSFRVHFFFGSTKKMIEVLNCEMIVSLEGHQSWLNFRIILLMRKLPEVILRYLILILTLSRYYKIIITRAAHTFRRPKDVLSQPRYPWSIIY